MATFKAYSNKPRRRETGLLAGMANERPIGSANSSWRKNLLKKTNAPAFDPASWKTLDLGG